MKIKIVPASELSSKTLRAKDYIMREYLVTYTETIQTEVRIQLPATTIEQAREELLDMDGSDFIALMRRDMRGKLSRVVHRALLKVEEPRV